MTCTIFYSWQSDLPNGTNRSFLGEALELAAADLRADDDLHIEPRIDSDTRGLPGSPDIVQAILAKIDQAAVFVGDVSIVHPEGVERRAPNPNVLVEHGWALKSLGAGRVLPVMNTAFGGVELLPFDLRQKRTVTYRLADGDAKAPVRKELVAKLKHHLKEMLGSLEAAPSPTRSPVVVATEAIEQGRPDQVSRVRAYMESLSETLARLDPHSLPGDQEEKLMKAIEKSIPLVHEFSVVVDAIAAMNAVDAGRAVMRGFEHILKHYSDSDLFKFVGHELLVTLAARMIREERWKLLGDLLRERVYQTNLRNRDTGPVSWDALSERVIVLEEVRAERTRAISEQANLLKDRHQEGPLTAVVSWDDFLACDFLLFLASAPQDASGLPSWRPRTFIYLHEEPRFLLEAKTATGLRNLRELFSDESPYHVRNRLVERIDFLAKLQRQAGVPFAERKLGFDPAGLGNS